MACMPGLRRANWPNAMAPSLLLVAALASGPAAAASIPADFRGVWAPRCTDSSAPRLTIESDSIQVAVGGRSHVFSGIDVSRTWIGGARASGPGIWFPTSSAPGQPFAFVAAAAQGAKGTIVLEEGHPDHGREIRSLFGVAFRRCPSEAAMIQPGSAAVSGEQPGYVGLWSRQLAWCADADSRIRFTLRGTEEIESACDFDRIEGGNGRWSVRQTCRAEGTTTRSRMDISVEGERMTLVFPGKKGSPTRLLRCR
ncbi:MAG TPA: hypothetical protein VGN82_12610 [Bosea sp. (in: a-proteobacteria)]|jgi:hypothetical protein|uniref:hypothetical protein n=1 Tax=Bosea sp. (in: a-proteobacteria) TaxID=1871050 RepID=UPI002E0FA6BB|nr:hypothetical protein [Bosea sp. (in: a-proteobacteria)]